jgi:MoaA/NifB/PqqE/SkfB family radical SAM enzyme
LQLSSSDSILQAVGRSLSILPDARIGRSSRISGRQVLIGEDEMIVVWRVVDSCNLSCPFCAFDRRLAFPRSAADPADILRVAGALAAYQARSGDRVLLSWLGGEPLLWRPLEELARAVRGSGLR